jgi:ABC-type lipopolysaccharide export system ATPase subunit
MIKRIHIIYLYTILLAYIPVTAIAYWLKIYFEHDITLSLRQIWPAGYFWPFKFFGDIPYADLELYKYQLLFISISIHIALSVSVYLYARRRFPLSIKKETALRDLGFYQEQRLLDNNNIPKNIRKLRAPIIEIHEDFNTINTPNFALSLDSVKSKKDELETIFNCVITEITRIPNSNDNIFKLQKDTFDKLEVEIEKVDFLTLPLGRNIKGEYVTINLKTAPFLGIFGVNGSGKTTLTKDYITLFKKSFKNDLAVHIIDAKGLDFKKTIQEGAIYHPAETEEDLKQVAEFLKNVLELKEKSKSIISEHGDGHAEDVRAKNIPLPLERMLIVFEEASAYLNDDEPNKAIREIKKEIINYTDKCFRQLRASGVFIIITNQTINKEALSLNLDQLHNILFNGLDVDMSRKHTQGNVGQFGIPSKWYLKSKIGNFFIKTPYNVETSYKEKMKSEVNMKQKKPFKLEKDYQKWMNDVVAITDASDDCLSIRRNYSTDKLSDEVFCELLKHLASNFTEKKEAYVMQSKRPHLISIAEIKDYLTVQDDSDSSDCNRSFETESQAGCSNLDFEEIEIIKTEPSNSKYKNTHVLVSIPILNVTEKLVSKTLSDEEIIKRFKC